MPAALILGCAENVWEDAIAALELFTPDAYFAVKDMMQKWPLRVDYGITLHPERTDGYLQNRLANGLAAEFPVWAHRHYSSMRKHDSTNDWAGSSGLFAVRVALKEGFDKIVLAGVPMDGKFGHITRKEKWTNDVSFRSGWRQRQSEIAPFVRSMSGWTKEILGVPTPEWLAQSGDTDVDRDAIEILKRMIELYSVPA
jgi:hypothetical protein